MNRWSKVNTWNDLYQQEQYTFLNNRCKLYKLSFHHYYLNVLHVIVERPLPLLLLLYVNDSTSQKIIIEMFEIPN